MKGEEQLYGQTCQAWRYLVFMLFVPSSDELVAVLGIPDTVSFSYSSP